MADAPPQAKSVPALSPRDTEILMAALKCLKGGPLEVNYADLAPMIGAKNANSANTSWLGVKKKLFPNGQAPAPSKGADSTATKSSKTPAKSKAADATKTPKSSTKKQIKSEVKAEAPATPEPTVSADDAAGVSKAKPLIANGDDAMDDTPVAKDNEADAAIAVKETTPATPGPKSNDAAPITPSPGPATTPAAKTPASTGSTATGKKRGRKSKAEKEAEAAAAAAVGDGDGDGEDEADDKPAKKRKTPAKPKANGASSIMPSIEPATPTADSASAEPVTPCSPTAADTATTPIKKAPKPRAPRKPKDPNAPPSARSKAGKALKAAEEAAKKAATQAVEQEKDKEGDEVMEPIEIGHPSAEEEIDAVLAAKNAAELGKKDDGETAATTVNDADMNAAIAATLDEAEADENSEISTAVSSNLSKTNQNNAAANGIHKEEQDKTKVNGAVGGAGAAKEKGKGKASTPGSEIRVEIPVTVKGVGGAEDNEDA